MLRYQECNKIVKMYRLRWKLLIPFIAVYNYIKGIKIYLDVNSKYSIVHTNHYEYANFKLCWRLASGYASSKMHHYYTSEEVMAMFRERYQNIDDDGA